MAPTTRAGSPLLARVKRVLGWMTGDRRVEAEGHAQERTARRQGAGAPVTPQEVSKAEQEVRIRSGDRPVTPGETATD